jgi:hypothetical protein
MPATLLPVEPTTALTHVELTATLIALSDHLLLEPNDEPATTARAKLAMDLAAIKHEK